MSTRHNFCTRGLQMFQQTFTTPFPDPVTSPPPPNTHIQNGEKGKGVCILKTKLQLTMFTTTNNTPTWAIWLWSSRSKSIVTMSKGGRSWSSTKSSSLICSGQHGVQACIDMSSRPSTNQLTLGVVCHCSETNKHFFFNLKQVKKKFFFFKFINNHMY